MSSEIPPLGPRPPSPRPATPAADAPTLPDDAPAPSGSGRHGPAVLLRGLLDPGPAESGSRLAGPLGGEDLASFRQALDGASADADRIEAAWRENSARIGAQVLDMIEAGLLALMKAMPLAARAEGGLGDLARHAEQLMRRAGDAVGALGADIDASGRAGDSDAADIARRRIALRERVDRIAGQARFAETAAEAAMVTAASPSDGLAARETRDALRAHIRAMLDARPAAV
jgi:hypothetical protein